MGLLKKFQDNFKVVPKRKVALLFEEVHLRRFFEYFEIDCVFDVGANEGQYATMLRKKVGYKGDIISFEPIPAAAEEIRKKARADTRWHVEEVALDSAAGSATFNIMEGSQFSSLHVPSHSEVELFKERNKVIEKVAVRTATIGEMLAKYESGLHFERPFLKMDTQGHDLDIAKGAGDALGSFVGIQSELSIKKIYENTPDYKTLIDYYISQGFELSAFVPNNEGHFPRLIEIDSIFYNQRFIQE